MGIVTRVTTFLPYGLIRYVYREYKKRDFVTFVTVQGAKCEKAA
jgi:hypothetical protein